MIFLAIVLAFVGLILTLCGASILLQKHRYDQCSVPVTATVLYKYAHSARSGKVFELQVLYTVDGVDYKKHIRTNGEDFALQCEGSKIELLYKPSHPKRAVRPMNAKDARSGGGLLITGVAMLVCGVALFLIAQLG